MKFQLLQVVPYFEMQSKENGELVMRLIGRDVDNSNEIVIIHCYNYEPSVLIRKQNHEPFLQSEITEFLYELNDKLSKMNRVKYATNFSKKEICMRPLCDCEHSSNKYVNGTFCLKSMRNMPQYDVPCSEVLNPKTIKCDNCMNGRSHEYWNCECKEIRSWNPVYRYEREMGRSLLLYQKDESEFIRLYLKSTSYIRDILRIAQNKLTYGSSGPDFEKYMLFECHNNEIVKFLSDIGGNGCCVMEIDETCLNTRVSKVSKYDHEYNVDVKHIKINDDVSIISKIHLMGFDIETVTNDPKSRRFGNALCDDPIIQIGYMSRIEGEIYEDKTGGFNHTTLCLKDTGDIPNGVIRSFESEFDLLKAFIEAIAEFDPDIFTGYNVAYFDFLYIIQRCQQLGLINYFSQELTRLKDIPTFTCFKEIQSKQKGNIDTMIINAPGRIVYDLFLAIRGNVMFKFNGYSLNTVCYKILIEPVAEEDRDKLHPELQKKGDVKYDDIYPLYQTKEGRTKIAEYCMHDVVLCLILVETLASVKDLVQTARVLGAPINLCITNQMNFQIWSKLLHEIRAYPIKYFVPTFLKEPYDPDRPSRKIIHEYNHEWPSQNKVGKTRDFTNCFTNSIVPDNYEGATVLEPVPGLYVNGITAVFDFASLYPSIIRQHNLCWTTYCPTLEYAKMQGLTEDDLYLSPTGHYFVNASILLGVLPHMESSLADLRTYYKGKMKEAAKRGDKVMEAIYNVLQNVVKIVMNSAYGMTGALTADIPCVSIAETVTSQGRRYLEITVNWFYELCGRYDSNENYGETEKKYQCLAIYGDTDSVFIYFPYLNDLKEIFEFCHEIERKINDPESGGLYVKPMYLEFEKCYPRFLMTNKKKRYAGYKHSDASNPGKFALDVKGMECSRRDNCSWLRTTLTALLHNALSKDEEYSVKMLKESIQRMFLCQIDLTEFVITTGLKTLKPKVTQKHVEVAKRAIQRGDTTIKIGDRIDYVFVRRDGRKRACEFAEKYEYVVEHNIPMDTEYYFRKQLEKPITKILKICYGDKTCQNVFDIEQYDRVEKPYGPMATYIGAGDRKIRKRRPCELGKNELGTKKLRQMNIGNFFAKK